MGTLAWVVFHNPDWCDGPDISPLVHNHWSRPVVDLLLESEAPFSTNDVGLACARFIGWCHTRPDVDSFQLGVGCVPERPDPEGVTDEAEWGRQRAAWYERAIRRLAASELSVLVNLATLEITQRGVVLWRRSGRGAPGVAPDAEQGAAADRATPYGARSS